MAFKSSLRRLAGTYHILHRQWPRPARKATAWLMFLELIGLVPALVIFGIAQPNLYRTDMWQIGYEYKLNSNPDVILYAYANHRPLPTIPLIWSKTLTDLNVAISIISLFFLLARLILYIMHVWYPIVSLLVNFALIALYSVSTYGQVGPDYLDERYPAPAAWYFRKGCDLAKPFGKYKTCRIAQGSLVVTLYMLVVYLFYIGFTLWAMWPNPVNDLTDDEYEQENDNDAQSAYSTAATKNRTVEMRSLHTPGFATTDSPFTPRTTAFHTLNRDLPLRQGYA